MRQLPLFNLLRHNRVPCVRHSRYTRLSEMMAAKNNEPLVKHVWHILYLYNIIRKIVQLHYHSDNSLCSKSRPHQLSTVSISLTPKWSLRSLRIVGVDCASLANKASKLFYFVSMQWPSMMPSVSVCKCVSVFVHKHFHWIDCKTKTEMLIYKMNVV